MVSGIFARLAKSLRSQKEQDFLFEYQIPPDLFLLLQNFSYRLSKYPTITISGFST